MNTLVTGGAGFIGSHVAEVLLRRGHRVVVLNDLSGGFLDNVPAGAEFVQGSIADAASWRGPVLRGRGAARRSRRSR